LRSVSVSWSRKGWADVAGGRGGRGGAGGGRVVCRQHRVAGNQAAAAAKCGGIGGGMVKRSCECLTATATATATAAATATATATSSARRARQAQVALAPSPRLRPAFAPPSPRLPRLRPAFAPRCRSQRAANSTAPARTTQSLALDATHRPWWRRSTHLDSVEVLRHTARVEGGLRGSLVLRLVHVAVVVADGGVEHAVRNVPGVHQRDGVRPEQRQHGAASLLRELHLERRWQRLCVLGASS
jgi:hypothetical protein